MIVRCPFDRETGECDIRITQHAEGASPRVMSSPPWLLGEGGGSRRCTLSGCRGAPELRFRGAPRILYSDAKLWYTPFHFFYANCVSRIRRRAVINNGGSMFERMYLLRPAWIFFFLFFSRESIKLSSAEGVALPPRNYALHSAVLVVERKKNKNISGCERCLGEKFLGVNYLIRLRSTRMISRSPPICAEIASWNLLGSVVSLDLRVSRVL